MGDTLKSPAPGLRNTLTAAALAALLAATGCTAQNSGTVPTGGTTPSVASAAASPTASAPTSVSASVPATAPATAPGAPPEVAGLQTFTFPDGHISFTYPAGWKVQTKQGPYLDEGSKAGSVQAAVLDQTGAEVVSISSGMYGDGAAGPVKRTVLDQAPVPGIIDATGKPAEFGFALDEVQPDGSSYYFMDVRLAAEFLPGQDSSGSNQVPLGNGIMAAYVVFDYTRQPVFATPDAAKAWMATEQYKQLKSLLLSLKYA